MNFGLLWKDLGMDFGLRNLLLVIRFGFQVNIGPSTLPKPPPQPDTDYQGNSLPFIPPLYKVIPLKQMEDVTDDDTGKQISSTTIKMFP